ncbi:MAG: methyltransferase domain-containing protein [Bacteroidales bacterium]|nr:methyltransferase domain-containing protein [Bacteroidales bacterium]
MNIELIKKLSNKPQLYEKGTAVMWTDPYISQQLLELHLNPDHDIASRSKAKIENISRWILERSNKPNMKILDLGCGPGLYAELFAKKGHSVIGIDISANSIQYAIKQAKEKRLDIEYLHKNYLDLDFENQFDLVILIYLDFCVLLPDERDKVLENIFKALKKGGLFICDVINERNLDKKILSKSWEVQKRGFWKNAPCIVLTNGYHYPEAKILLEHHTVIGDNDIVDTYVFWSHYYKKNDLTSIFESKGFTNIRNYENVLPDSDDYWNGENVTFYVLQK